MFAPRPRAIRWVVPFVAASFLITAAAGSAFAQTPVQVVVSFDESQGQNPEGLAIDRTGAIFVSVSPLGDVWRIAPGSDDPQPFGHVDGIVPGRDFGLLGLAVDVFGNVYGAVQSADAAANGVWRFDRFTGDATRLPGTACDQPAERSRVRQAGEPVRDRFRRAARSGGSRGVALPRSGSRTPN